MSAPGRLKSALIPVAAMLAALLLLTSLPYLLQAYGVGLVTETLIIGLWAVSLNVLAGQTGLISLGHASTLGTSSYVLALLQRDLEWSFFQAAPVAVAAAVAISVLFALTAARSAGVYFILVTLAQGMLVWGVVQRWSSITGGDDGMRGIERPEAFSDYYSYYWFALWIVGASLIALLLIQRSKIGLRLRGIRDSPKRMAALGYSVGTQRLVAFCISGFFAGVAGVLYAGHVQFISPTTVYVTQSVEGLLMVILGGINSFFGPLIGAIIVLFGRAGLSLYTERWLTIMGAILILVVLFGHDGIAGRAGALFRAIRRRVAGGAE
ncbi:branched-chain amino acid ABC transporter permease [Streptomyces sp. NPDC000880]